MANFKTRARTLDLLGRQQIAGIPTAINELLKNAHDAYADNVDIDYLRLKNLFILRDNGLGMTKTDFETRWLTLGTESKVKYRKSTPPPIDESKAIRVSMGEKGIGRLAIASIGKQVLIVTKAKHKDGITVALINWQIFELPGLNLEDIVVPVATFSELPCAEDINVMKSELLNSLDKLLNQDDITQSEHDLIADTIKSFNLSPKEFNKTLVGDFSLNQLSDGGTYFYVSAVDEMLNIDIDGSQKTKDATKIEKMLMGFHNTMTPEHPKPILNIVFRDYKGDDGAYLDVIDKEHFFTKNDFELADHHIKGGFDEFGQFKGMVKIYQERTFDHIVNWRANNFNKTQCGSFEINFAYIQGKKADSIISSEDYLRITAKADKFGGLYIYKDNIRILPYGDSDYDYLDIEKNRSKRAATAFFSYRRMFGVINLSQEQNLNLKEKAGREGFIENKAYRQLQEILKNFFAQLAADFFREDNTSPRSEIWADKRSELKAIHEALEKRKKQAKAKKTSFEAALSKFFTDRQAKVFEQDIDNILMDAQQAFNGIYSERNQDTASQKILDIESSVRQALFDYRKKNIIPTPRGFLVRGELKRDFETYVDEFESIDSALFSPANSTIDSLVESTSEKLEITVSKRRRLEQAVDFISKEAWSVNSAKKKVATETANAINTRVKELTSELMIDLDDQVRAVKDKFKTITIFNESDINLVAKRNKLSDEIHAVSERNTKLLDTVIRQLEGIYWEKDENNNYITNEQITNALGEELEELREQVHTDVELSQLGLAVSVIHHEFNSTVRSVRSSLKDLRSWSDVNEELEGIYKNIKINFEHLDGYLNLFTPLNRRLNRKTEDIKLLEIKTFLIDLFKSRLNRHGISFKHTKAFTRGEIRGFRSSFYPVFVNVIDNAIYWLSESGVEDKVIRLHSDEEGSIYISNNGIEIPINDKAKIFKLGFSRKENGRGMGLHISNEVLENAGYLLQLIEPREGSNVTFKLVKMELK